MHIHFSRHRIERRHELAFVKTAIAAAKAAIEDEPGCVRVDLFRDIDAPGILWLCRVYATKAASDAHAGEATKTLPGTSPLRLRARSLFPADADFKKAKSAPLPAAPRKDQRYVHWGIWPLKPQHRAAWVKATIPNARASARTEWGCYRFDILQDLDDRNRFYLYQLYYDQWFHDEIHANKIYVGRLKANPGWILWPDRKAAPPLGRRSPTGLSHTVRGLVLWSSATLSKPGRPPARPR
jgi:quinol monooxygenase YgiN